MQSGPMPKCEQCKYSFNTKKLGQAVLLECPKCKTTLVPNIVLKKFFPQKVFEQFRRDVKAQQIKSAVKCPQCRGTMSKMVGLLKSKHFDSCANCDYSLIDLKAAEEITEFARHWEENYGKISLAKSPNSFEMYFLGKRSK